VLLDRVKTDFFSRLVDLVGSESERELKRLAYWASGFAVSIAPVKSGALRDAIGVSKDSGGWSVVSRVPRGRGEPYQAWWHGLGGKDLRKIALERNWVLSGGADAFGSFSANEYMFAVRDVAMARLRDSGKRVVSNLGERVKIDG